MVELGDWSQNCEPGPGLGKGMNLESKTMQAVCHVRKGLVFTVMPKLKGQRISNRQAY